MKYLAAIALSVLVMILATPAMAQRDANTSSARAAYGAPGYNSGLNAKKNKKKAKKKSRKARKAKTRTPQTDRDRRRSLHF